MFKEKYDSLEISVIMLKSINNISSSYNVLMNASLNIAEATFSNWIENLDFGKSNILKELILDSFRVDLERKLDNKFKKDKND